MAIFTDRYGTIRSAWLVASIVTGAALLLYGTWRATVYYSNQGCGYVCEANGDENAYRWDAGCWCRDDQGVYNPQDSRNDQ